MSAAQGTDDAAASTRGRANQKRRTLWQLNETGRGHTYRPNETHHPNYTSTRTRPRMSFTENQLAEHAHHEIGRVVLCIQRADLVMAAAPKGIPHTTQSP